MRRKKLLTSKKSASALISAVLLIFITIVSSSVIYLWMDDVNHRTMNSIEEDLHDEQIKSQRSFVILSSVTCEASSNNISFYLKNTGTVKIYPGTLILNLIDIDSAQVVDSIIDSSFQGINVEQILSLEMTSNIELNQFTQIAFEVIEPSGKAQTAYCEIS